MTKKTPPGITDADAAIAIRELMKKLRRNEIKYLAQAGPGRLPRRKHVIEATMASLMVLRRSFAKLGGFEFANLPVHLKILFDELATVNDGTPSRLFSPFKSSRPSHQVTHRTRLVRAQAVAVVDLLMEPKLGVGCRREDACRRVATALNQAGYGPFSWLTILDWRKEAHSPSSQPTFQEDYDITKRELYELVRNGKSPAKLLEELPVHLRALLFE